MAGGVVVAGDGSGGARVMCCESGVLQVDPRYFPPAFSKLERIFHICAFFV